MLLHKVDYSKVYFLSFKPRLPSSSVTVKSSPATSLQVSLNLRVQSKSCFLTIFPSNLLENKGSCQDFYGNVQVFVSLKTRCWPKSAISRSQSLNRSLPLKKKESSRFQCLQSRCLGAESSLYHQVFASSFTVHKRMHMAAQKNCYVHHTQFSLLCLMNQCLSTQGSYC